MKMRYFYFVLYLFLSLNFSSLTYAVEAPSLPYKVLADTINKSDRDDRQYQVIQLDNGMKVLLISDPKAVKSLASLSLSAGSWQDPVSQQGLAHYTEHMVLMGSKKYPKPSDFSEFLSQHAGSSNASTADYRTSFYFEVENSAFIPALDRLADAIAEPLFDPSNADKERNAVDAEMTMARSNDGFRMKRVDSETINQDHPSSMFSGGNLQTLSNKTDSILQKELEAFYQHYYSANIMVGVLYSNQSLSELRTAAIDTFGRIANRNVHVEPITQEAIGPSNTAKWIYMEPAQPKKALYIQFPIKNNIADYSEKSDEYIAYLISNRSPNTLFDQLKTQGLIESISAGADSIRYGNGGIFTIYVNLTDEGLAKKDAVVADIFAYLKLIDQQGISQQYYDEIKKVLALEFKYQDISRDMSYVEWLSDQMLLYPTEHILDADYVTSYFNRQAIEDRLNYLTIDHARIWVIAPNQQTDKVAYFFNVPYRTEDIDQNQMNDLIKQAEEKDFSLPIINPYIVNDFTIYPQQADVQQNNEFSPTGNNIHFASRYFPYDPKAALILSLRNNTALETVDNQVMFNLLDYLANRDLATLHFQASYAGIDLSTGPDSGLAISLDGFNQHLGDMLLTVLDTYRSTEINDENLKLAKSKYLEKLDVAEHVNSYTLAMQPVNALSSIPYFERESKRIATTKITAEQLKQYRDDLLVNAVPYMLSVGNITEEQSIALYDEVKKTLNQHADFSPQKLISVTQQTNALISQKTATTDNALFVGFVPVGYDWATARVTSFLMYKIISPWFYDQLRSDEQLGYAVFSLPIYLGDSSGIGFLIQSNQYDPVFLNERYRAFYPVALDKLNALTDEEFSQYKQSILNDITMPPQTLSEEFSDYMFDYYRSQFNFESKQQKIDALNKLTKADVIKFFQQAVIDQTGLVLDSEVLGKQENHESKSINDLPVYSGATELQKVLLDKQ